MFNIIYLLLLVMMKIVTLASLLIGLVKRKKK